MNLWPIHLSWIFVDGVNKNSTVKYNWASKNSSLAELRPFAVKISLIVHLAGGESPYSQEFANGKMTKIEHQQSQNYQLQ